MNSVSYNPSNDELVLELHPLKKEPTREFERYRFWWDDEGNILGLSISSFRAESEEFKKNLKTIRLGGILKGIKITEEDIKEAQRDLLKKLEDKW